MTPFFLPVNLKLLSFSNKMEEPKETQDKWTISYSEGAKPGKQDKRKATKTEEEDPKNI